MKLYLLVLQAKAVTSNLVGENNTLSAVVVGSSAAVAAAAGIDKKDHFLTYN